MAQSAKKDKKKSDLNPHNEAVEEAFLYYSDEGM